ncbi:uncharacterized protein LOC129753283 [Uranotaenia lowii]|uniref:uncharacterized protein LOC129753283 n=1 Tax=Uranotaenia lowii TaxID=190385 RepID=UPI00247930E6|nr:uncharacterized protein LOC129753283 [Uranotaenia lowii]
MGDNPPPWGSDPLPSSSNRRRLPDWMDPKGEHGEIQFLLLKPTTTAKLPAYPFIISKTVELAAGQIVGGHPYDKGESYLLKVRSPKQVEKLLAVNELIDSTPINITLHPTLNTCKCIVTCKEVAGISNQQLASDLASQGVTNVYRFLRKVDGKEAPTDTFVLTIQGTTAPAHIRFGFLRTPTRQYYPRPMMCMQCGKFGHTKKHCKNALVCLICGEQEIHTNCQLTPNCVNCKNPHPTTSRICPVFVGEQDIIKIRTDRGISHNDAVKEYRSRQNQTSSIQQRLNQASSSSSVDAKDREIAELRRQVAFLTAQIATFSQLVKEKQRTNESQCSSESDTSMESNNSTISKASTTKRFWKTSSDDSPPGAETNPQDDNKIPNRPKKKRHRRPNNANLPAKDLTVDSNRQNTHPTPTVNPSFFLKAGKSNQP